MKSSISTPIPPPHLPCPFSTQDELEQFAQAVDEQLSKARSDAIAASLTKAERQLASLVSGPVHSLLDASPQGLWPKLHALCHDASASAEKGLFQVCRCGRRCGKGGGAGEGVGRCVLAGRASRCKLPGLKLKLSAFNFGLR